MTTVSTQRNFTETEDGRKWRAESVLEYIFSKEDHGKKLRCLAFHEAYDARSREVQHSLNILCKLSLSLSLSLPFNIDYIGPIWHISFCWYQARSTVGTGRVKIDGCNFGSHLLLFGCLCAYLSAQHSINGCGSVTAIKFANAISSVFHLVFKAINEQESKKNSKLIALEGSTPCCGCSSHFPSTNLSHACHLQLLYAPLFSSFPFVNHLFSLRLFRLYHVG